jgi:hypothetical protein
MALHGRYSVPDEPESHVPIRGGLVFDEHVDITVIPSSGFQAVEHVAEVLAEVIFHKGA